MTQPQIQNETDNRINILNNLLTTPHRDLKAAQPIHDSLVKSDPLFYRQLAAWYSENGDIRDHQQLFAANLIISEFDGHRDVGLALLREMPPYQVVRVIDFIKKDLGRNLPRSLRTELLRYLREREGDNKWFDSSAVTARDALKRMYALCHIAPSERAQAILFDQEPPTDSAMGQIKALRGAETPTDQARVIMENKIPYRIASTIISQMTPTVIYALIDVMSAQELINNIGSLKKRGAFNNPDLKAKIDAKLGNAKTAKNVSALKSMEAIKNVDVDEETAKQLADIADTQIKNKGRIKLHTALLIDKSQSMSRAIDMGKRVGAMISSAMADEARFYCYAFDVMPYPITTTGKSLADWTKAMNGIYANGATHNGSAVLALLQNRQKVDQIVMVTDEGENRIPSFVQCLQAYEKEMGVKPSVVILRVPSDRNYRWDGITRSLRHNGFEVEDYNIEGDYYSEPTILSFLTKKSKFELLMEVMSFRLPRRKTQ